MSVRGRARDAVAAHRDAETIVWTRCALWIGRGRVVPYAVGRQAEQFRPVLAVTFSAA